MNQVVFIPHPHPFSLHRRRFFGGAFLVCLPLDFCGLLLAFVSKRWLLKVGF
jgi:hypothetical protein